jgi:CelD/BcsL family acetyltransferase involved in cellulose biosynthesis
MNIELVTDRNQLERFTEGWERLADTAARSRSGAGIVTAWAHHMMETNVELRIWFATEGSELVGVLPLVAVSSPRGRVQLLPPARTLMYGVIPIAQPGREREIAVTLAEQLADSLSSVDLVRIDWLPVGSPWLETFASALAASGLVAVNSAPYASSYANLAGGFDAWFARRKGDFRSNVGRRARRREEEGFRLCTTVDTAEIVARLPAIQRLYRGRQHARGGDGYHFGQTMIDAISDLLAVSRPARLRLITVERREEIIAMQISVNGGNMTCGWLTAYESEWSRFAPGIAAIIEGISASCSAGYDLFDFGPGDENFKSGLTDGEAALESGIWCTARIARLLEPAGSDARAVTELGQG